MTGRLALEFIGHLTVLIALGGIRTLTDPVTRSRVGPLRRVEAVPHRDRLHGIDLVLLSHLQPPATLAECAAELAPDVRTLPTAVGDVVVWDA